MKDFKSISSTLVASFTSALLLYSLSGLVITRVAAQGVVDNSLGTDLLITQVPKNKIVAALPVGNRPEAIAVSPRQ